MAIDSNSVLVQQRVSTKASHHMLATWLVLVQKYKGYAGNI